MKKGFTIVEIIISIGLIALISTIGVIIYRNSKPTEEELIEEYRNHVLMDAAVYYDKYKDTDEFANIKEVGDWKIIQLKSLIEFGVLPEELYNPVRKSSSKDSAYDCVKVYLDEEMGIKIEYPTETCEDKTPEEIEQILKVPQIHINNEKSQFLVYKDSYEILELGHNYPDLIPSIQSAKVRPEFFYSSDYWDLDQNLEDNKIEGAYVVVNDEIKDVPAEYWDINRILLPPEEKVNKNLFPFYWNSEIKVEWKIIYSLKEGVNLSEYGITDASLIKPVSRVVSLVDISPSILIDMHNDFKTYSPYTDIIDITFNKTDFPITLSPKYVTIDNFDGLTSDVLEECLVTDSVMRRLWEAYQFNHDFNLLKSEFELKKDTFGCGWQDTAGNTNGTNLNLNLIDPNRAPIIEYFGPYSIDVSWYCDTFDDKFTLGCSSWSPYINHFDEYIKITDPDGDEFDWIHLLTNYDNDQIIEIHTGSFKPFNHNFGPYTLEIYASDEHGAQSTEYFQVTINFVEWPPIELKPEFSDNYDNCEQDYCGTIPCDDLCIIEQMEYNTQLMLNTTSESEKTALAVENSNLASQLSVHVSANLPSVNAQLGNYILDNGQTLEQYKATLISGDNSSSSAGGIISSGVNEDYKPTYENNFGNTSGYTNPDETASLMCRYDPNACY